MFGIMATMPFVLSPPRFGSRDIGPIILVGGIGRMDTGDTNRGLLNHSPPRDFQAEYSSLRRLDYWSESPLKKWRYVLLGVLRISSAKK
jgi:hypothetical protein